MLTFFGFSNKISINLFSALKSDNIKQLQVKPTVPVFMSSTCFVSNVQVQSSPVFRRNGADIHSDAFISVAQAILGGTATTQGLYETISMVVS